MYIRFNILIFSCFDPYFCLYIYTVAGFQRISVFLKNSLSSINSRADSCMPPKKRRAHVQGANPSWKSNKPYNLGDLTPAQRPLSTDDLIANLIEENKKLKATIWEKQKYKYKKTRQKKKAPCPQVSSQL